MDLALRRRFFAEELEAVCRLRAPYLVNALATVPREQYLGPGPWTVLVGKAMMAAPAQWQAVKRLRRDAHEPAANCWYHTPRCCLSTE
jgi:hypothetical protein